MNANMLLTGFMLGLITSADLLSGATLTATFSFEKRPPDIGVIYFPEDGGSKVQPVVDQKAKDFAEQLIIGPKGSKIILKNSDEIAHNIYADDVEANVKFDIGLADPKSLHDLPLSWDEGVFVKIGCKIHPKMRAWIGSIKSQYFTVTKFEDKNEATFTMTAPDALTKVRLWLSNSFDSVDAQVNSGNPVTIPLTKKGKSAGSVILKRM